MEAHGIESRRISVTHLKLRLPPRMSLFNRSPLFGLNLCDTLFRGSLHSFSPMAVPMPSNWAPSEGEVGAVGWATVRRVACPKLLIKNPRRAAGKPYTAVSTLTQGA
jgi:hypothetical protein